MALEIVVGNKIFMSKINLLQYCKINISEICF